MRCALVTGVQRCALPISRYGAEPYRLASLGYDSVLLVNRVAANWRPDTPFPRAVLHDSGGYAGVDGAFKFNGAGIAVRALEVQQIGNGGFEEIGRASCRERVCQYV